MLKIYLACSQKYYFQYEDQYVKQHKQEFEQKTPPLFVGQVVHRCIERFFKTPLEERDWPRLMRLLQESWLDKNGARQGERWGFASREEEAESYKQAQEMLRTFFTIQGDVTHIAYIGNQESFEEMLQSVLEKDLMLFGRVDRIDRDGDGLHIIDYKTGKDTDDEFQLMIYTFLAEVHMQEPVKRASYFYLKTSEFKTFEPDETLRRETMSRIEHTARAIQRGQFSPRVSRVCQWCPFLQLCPAREQVQELLAAGAEPVHEDFF